MYEKADKWVNTAWIPIQNKPEHIIDPLEQSLLLDKPFRLPKEYESVLTAVSSLRLDHPLEKEFLTDILYRLTIAYTIGVILMFIIIGSDTLMYKYGTEKDTYTSCSNLNVTSTMLNTREIIKYVIITPAGLLFLLLNFVIQKRQSSNKAMTLIYLILVLLVGLGLISISLLGLKPNHGKFETSFIIL